MKHFLLVFLLVLSACAENKFTSSPVPEVNQSGIIGGSYADPHEAVTQHTVFVRFDRVKADGSIFSAFCTGALIAPKVVLTAAHCLKVVNQTLQNVEVYFTRDWSNLSKLKAYSALPIVHSEYNPEGTFLSGHDIALLFLSERAPSPYVPVPILQDFSLLTPGQTLVVTGFGMVNFENKKYDAFLKKLEVEVFKDVVSFPDFIDVRPKISGSATCHGDSGGPAFLKIAEKYFLVGILKGGNCTSNSVYTRLDVHKNFLSQAFVESALNLQTTAN